MPAAALDGKHKQWRTKRRKAKAGYLFNHKALAKVFRAKMLAAIEAAGLTLPRRYPEKWVVDCKSVGSGEKALIYLGRYLYRGVIAEKDIVACDNGQVSFRYRNAKTGKMERRTVSGAHFLWLVLQHVLPKGFRRARNFGFLHPNCKRLIALLHLLLKFDPGQAAAWFKKRAPILCTCCGAVMVIVKTRIRVAFRGAIAGPHCHQGAADRVSTRPFATYREFSAHKLRHRLALNPAQSANSRPNPAAGHRNGSHESGALHPRLPGKPSNRDHFQRHIF